MKNKVKIILIIFLTMFLSIAGTALAQTLIKSSEVTYDNSKSNGSFDNVQESLDELYSKAGYTGEEYHEEILHGADPVLSGELVPVYLADNGDVYYANTHTKWYSYEYKKWANAVILVDDAYGKNREDNKDKYSVGDKISEEDIESYFVWIPRYAYKLWDLGEYTSAIDAKTLTDVSYELGVTNILGAARVIDITFGNISYLTGDTYKKLIRNSDGTFSDPTGLEIDQWLVHPAFTLGNQELNGFWIGKFETGFNQTNIGQSAITGTDKWTTDGAQNNSTLSNKVIIKPDVYSWRYINVGNMFNTAKGYYTELKSHMLKNTEWGAVAYLSHSLYGKGSEININNASDRKTGYSALNSDERTYQGQGGLANSSLNKAYNTSGGYLASTTDNITGVYDLAGGSLEYVAATMISGRTTDNSGLQPVTITEQMQAGYIDAYPATSTKANFSNRILGDATGELGPFYSYFDKDAWQQQQHCVWYSDYAYSVYDTNPWYNRGGEFYNGVLAGAFFFSGLSGEPYDSATFRIALAP